MRSQSADPHGASRTAAPQRPRSTAAGSWGDGAGVVAAAADGGLGVAPPQGLGAAAPKPCGGATPRPPSAAAATTPAPSPQEPAAVDLGRCGAAVREAPCGSADWLRMSHSIIIYSRSSRRKSRFWILVLAQG